MLRENKVYKMLHVSELLNRRPRSWLLEGLIPRGSFVVLYGPPKVGKSFLALDWSIRLAQRGNKIAYSAGEGLGGMGARLKAWKAHWGGSLSEEVALYFPDVPVNVHSAAETTKFRESLKEYEGFTVSTHDIETEEDVYLEGMSDLIVVDTLARAMVGADENDAGDVSLAIDHLDYLRRETGASVLVLHHTTKGSGGTVERGSTALRGAADVMLQLNKKDGKLRLLVEAARDFESGQEMWYQLLSEGDSAVLIPTDEEPVPPESPLQGAILEYLSQGVTQVSALVDATGKGSSNVSQALTKLVNKGQVLRVGRGEYTLASWGVDKNVSGG